MTAKERIQHLIDAQPDDATYEEILRELTFERMVDRGLKDVREGNVISNEDMGKRIKLWTSIDIYEQSRASNIGSLQDRPIGYCRPRFQ